RQRAGPHRVRIVDSVHRHRGDRNVERDQDVARRGLHELRQQHPGTLGAAESRNTVTTSEIIAIGIVLVACATDLPSRRIPNVLTFGSAAAGMVFALATSGMAGLGMSVAGWLIGCALFLPLFLLRGMGAGDVKLLAALGAWLGPASVIRVALYGSIA